VLIIVRPGLGGFRPAALIALGTALAFALVAICSKKLVTTESTFAILFWMNLMQLPMNVAGSDLLFVSRLESWMVLPLAGIGIAGVSTHFCQCVPPRRRIGRHSARFSPRAVHRGSRCAVFAGSGLILAGHRVELAIGGAASLSAPQQIAAVAPNTIPSIRHSPAILDRHLPRLIRSPRLEHRGRWRNDVCCSSSAEPFACR